MKCYAQFYLAGCASPLPDEYTEFHSVSEAKRSLLRQHESVSQYAEGPSEMLVFFGKPEGMFPCDCQPDRAYQTGPRGGIQQL